jgi:hypothetical protein
VLSNILGEVGNTIKNAGNSARYDNGIVSCQNYPEGITNTEGT